MFVVCVASKCRPPHLPAAGSGLHNVFYSALPPSRLNPPGTTTNPLITPTVDTVCNLHWLGSFVLSGSRFGIHSRHKCVLTGLGPLSWVSGCGIHSRHKCVLIGLTLFVLSGSRCGINSRHKCVLIGLAPLSCVALDVASTVDTIVTTSLVPLLMPAEVLDLVAAEDRSFYPWLAWSTLSSVVLRVDVSTVERLYHWFGCLCPEWVRMWWQESDASTSITEPVVIQNLEILLHSVIFHTKWK
jgi:hypothetical protein